VLGASFGPGADRGGKPIAYMIRQKFGRALYPVNPARDEVQGCVLQVVSALPEVPMSPWWRCRRGGTAGDF